VARWPGKTALSTVGQAGAGLTYRGYDVRELAPTRSSKKSPTCCCTATADQGRTGRLQAKLSKLRDLPQA
jgi:2-methylcitrate synthase